MASQAQLELLLADLRARLAAAQDKSITLSDETPTYIPSSAAIQEAQLINRNVVKPLLLEIEATEKQLAELLQIPDERITITSDRPQYTIADTTGLDLGPEIPNPIDTTGLDLGPEIPNPIDTTGLDLGPEIPVPTPTENTRGLQAPTNNTRAQQTKQDAANARTLDDWRVRLSLAAKSNYLYNANPAGILQPLKQTDGVVFPYVPQIQVTYAANYETSDIVHSNYKMIQYKNSAVDQITINGDFTAQDTAEANYLLAVIHFFRSVTKMFYGKDQIPKPGTPPPLCYLSGLGEFQFDEHPLVISSFNYSLPNDVDYIRASSPTLLSGVDSTGYNTKGGDQSSGDVRRQSGETPLNVGAVESPAKFRNYRTSATNTYPTYVPTKMSIAITAFPIVTRNDISNNFSVRDYATGKLLQGSKRTNGGIW